MNASPGTSPVLLRDARPADFTRIAAIYAHHVRTGFGTFDEVPPPPDEMLGRFQEIAKLGLPYLMAADGETIAGYAYAAPYRPRSAYRFTVEDSVYVAAASQRNGLGAMMLHALIARCAGAGMRQLVAVIGDSGNLASINLHEKCGFRRVGVMTDVGFKANRWLDTIIMQRGL